MFHTVSPTVALDQLKSTLSGLSTAEVIMRQTEYGLNQLPEGKKIRWYVKFFNQFKDILIVILLVAAIFSLFIGEIKDGVVILVIVLANAIMGFIQEMKADNAIAALKKLAVRNARVIRDGNVQVVEADQLVPGDIIELENGDKIPADARLLESSYLKIMEAALTGESKYVEKNPDFVGTEKLPLGDRLNMVYKDTVVLFGRGRAVVTGTGTNTEIGRIFQLLQKQETKVTALSRELDRVGKGLTIFAGISASIIFLTILITQTQPLRNAFLTAVSLAIAVVPEGIPAVVTTVLALSVARLAKSKAIIRKLEAVETLGAATHILTDKTGTLTQNKMSVTELYLPQRKIKVTNGKFLENETPISLSDDKLTFFLQCFVLCNDAEVTGADFVGDPTEGCLLQAAAQAGLNPKKIQQEFTRVFEIPFSSETKRMTVVVQHQQGQRYVITKGACETVFPEASVLELSNRLSMAGTRNLVFTAKELPAGDFLREEAFLLRDQSYIGTVGMKDPLRPEVKEAVAVATRAGIRTIMITGDHKLIAQNIGEELGIVKKEEEVMDGAQLASLTEDEWPAVLEQVRAFSRVSPEQKLHIVKLLASRGANVIVTGDGVNDAPAIRAADIGVSMGQSGTDVAKEAADVVLQDDNYATIVEAVRQGRGIFGNFIKFLIYQISCNLSGVLIIFFVTVLNFPPPLLPVHILLLNLISETGPSIALGLEKPVKNIMSLKPRHKKERLLTPSRWLDIVFQSLLLAIVGILAYFSVHSSNPAAALTVTLTTAFLSRLWHTLNCRSETYSIFSRNLQYNPALLVIMSGTLAVFLLAVYTPLGNDWIKTVPLTGGQFSFCLLLSLIPVVGMEVQKMFKKIKRF